MEFNSWFVQSTARAALMGIWVKSSPKNSSADMNQEVVCAIFTNNQIGIGIVGFDFIDMVNRMTTQTTSYRFFGDIYMFFYSAVRVRAAMTYTFYSYVFAWP